MISRWLLATSLPASIALASVGNAQLCANTAPLAQASIGTGSAITGVHESADASRIAAVVSNSVHFRQPSDLADAGRSTLADVIWNAAFDTNPGAPSIFLGIDNGNIGSLGGPGGLDWSRNLARSGCGNDEVKRPAHHARALATADFQAAHPDDLVYVPTDFAFDGSAGCSGDYRTDNRVFALNVGDGSVEWTFNGAGSEDVDGIAGVALDTASDRLYLASDRTFSTSQHSVWALDVLTGTKVWSVDAGRITVPPALFEGRLYLATTMGEIKALDPADGSEHWSFSGTLPLLHPAELTVVALDGGGVAVAIPDSAGQIRVIRDDGANATPISWFQLPGGAPGTAPASPSVKAVSRILADGTAGALIGADDGKVYPADLVAGTVGAPLVAAAATEAAAHLVLEPPGIFASPASFLVGTSDAVLARYCTALGGPALVPSLGPAGLGLAVAVLIGSAVVLLGRRDRGR